MDLEYPDNLKYYDSHEYALLEGDVAKIGITAYAVDELGDIVFLELPEVGDEVEKGESFGTVESVKAVEDLVSPVSGAVIERNEALIEAPENLSDDPYDEGWLIKVSVEDPTDLDDALSSEEYQAKVEGEEEDSEDEED
ncbi:MAG: glycine cleavage system protein GcvH [Leptolyngbyaceae bacterium]|nr:glycine cleavage system protein GcvH [Leptolyngbyaceae bacterium]